MYRVILLSLFLFISRATANWGGYADGNLGTGSLRGSGLDQVEMVSESLYVELHKQYANIEVKYQLHNTAGPVEVKAGFPCVPCHNSEKDTTKPELDVVDYCISADGNVLKYNLVEGKKEKWFKLSGTASDMAGMEEMPNSKPDSTMTETKIYWMDSKLSFEKDQDRRVTITYKAKYQSGGGGFSQITDFDSEILRYFLHTGASWKGPIQHGFVRIHNISKDADRIKLMPDSVFKRNGNDFTWKFSNLEPTLKDNIVIDFNDAYTSPYDFSAGIDKKIESWYIFEGSNYYFNFHGYTVKASSTLSNKKAYQAENIADFDEKTAWVEGKEGPGIGENLTLVLDKPSDIYAIGILSGYFKSRDVYYNNNRIAKLRVTVNEKQSQDYDLYDDFNDLGAKEHRAYQFLTLPASDAPVKTLRLTILDVYKGSKYDDACISEVLLRKKLSEKPAIHGAR